MRLLRLNHHLDDVLVVTDASCFTNLLHVLAVLFYLQHTDGTIT